MLVVPTPVCMLFGVSSVVGETGATGVTGVIGEQMSPV